MYKWFHKEIYYSLYWISVGFMLFIKIYVAHFKQNKQRRDS